MNILDSRHKLCLFVVSIVQSLFDLQAPDQSLHQSSHQHIFLSRTITCLTHEESLLSYQQPSCLSCMSCSNTWTLFSTLNSDMNVIWKLWLHLTILVQALEAWCMYCRSGFTYFIDYIYIQTIVLQLLLQFMEMSLICFFAYPFIIYWTSFMQPLCFDMEQYLLVLFLEDSWAIDMFSLRINVNVQMVELSVNIQEVNIFCLELDFQQQYILLVHYRVQEKILLLQVISWTFPDSILSLDKEILLKHLKDMCKVDEQSSCHIFNCMLLSMHLIECAILDDLMNTQEYHMSMLHVTVLWILCILLEILHMLSGFSYCGKVRKIMIPFKHIHEIRNMLVCSDYFFDAFRFWEAVAVFWIRSCWAFFSAFFFLRDSEIFFLCSSESGIPFVVFFSLFQYFLRVSTEFATSSALNHGTIGIILKLIHSMNSSNSDFLVSLNARMNAQNTRASPAIINHSWSVNHGRSLMWKSANQ